MDTQKQKQLQADALFKLRESNFSPQIQNVATKPLPLTSQDIAQLEHFIDSDYIKLKNTVYWANTIVSPVVSQRETIDLRKKQSKNSNSDK
jgi:hypothetical protein